MADLSYEDLRRGAVNILANAGIENPELDARILLEKASGKSSADLIMCSQEIVPETIQMEFHEMLGCRAAHEPIAYILGEKPFWSLDFKVNEHVLIPRPETEGVVMRALELLHDQRAPHILDVGTGSGAILISLLHERPDATGCGLDISEAALKVAGVNSERLGVATRCRLELSNYLREAPGRYDIIVSNPPYINDISMNNLAPDIELYEPELALRGGRTV